MEQSQKAKNEPEPKQAFATKWTAALITIACVAFVGFQGSRIINHRTQLWNEDRTHTANLTSSLIKHAELSVRTADALLVATTFGIEHRLFTEDNRSVLKSLFSEEVSRSAQFITFTLIDSGGKLVIGASGSDRPIDLSDREYFKYHQTHDDRQVHIGSPVRGRITDQWFIPVTRRFNRPDGSFDGVIVAALNPKFFLDAYEQLDVGKDGAIMLASLDRKLLVRRPSSDGDVGRVLPVGIIFNTQDNAVRGSIDVVSPIDGVRRILSYGESKEYPLLVTVAKSVDETLAPWRRDTMQIAIETASIVGLMLLLGVIIGRVTGRLADKAVTLQDANERFDTAINTMSHGLSLFDANKRLVIVNSRFIEMYRLTDEIARPGILFSELKQIQDDRGDVLIQSATNSGPSGLPVLPHRCLLNDGSIIAIRRSFTPTGGWVSIHEDVTDRERAAEALVAAKEAAEAAARAKSDFLAMMSHEIRTPMAGMMGMIHLLAETELDQEQQQLANTAQESARNLLAVVNDILDFSKLEAGKVTAEVIDFDIKNPIRSVVALLGQKAREKGLVLQPTIAPGMPQIMKGDPSRISQVLLNLVGNAIKFTKSGSVNVAASYRLLEDDGLIELRMEVTDTGLGIPADTLTELFQPFKQADTSVSRKYGGTGLGLAICKRLCETMGGAIGVESKPGHGSTFWFTVLCKRQEIAGGIAQDVIAPRLVPSGSGGGRPLAVLVADDNAIIRTLISKLLERRGFMADLVCTGKEAVEALQSRNYDLVLMDMQMPEMDGITAAKAIRALNGPQRGVPIIALTANALVGQREICLSAGMNGFLTKPIQPEALYDAIQHWSSNLTNQLPNEVH